MYVYCVVRVLWFYRGKVVVGNLKRPRFFLLLFFIPSCLFGAVHHERKLSFQRKKVSQVGSLHLFLFCFCFWRIAASGGTTFPQRKAKSHVLYSTKAIVINEPSRRKRTVTVCQSHARREFLRIENPLTSSNCSISTHVMSETRDIRSRSEHSFSFSLFRWSRAEKRLIFTANCKSTEKQIPSVAPELSPPPWLGDRLNEAAFQLAALLLSPRSNKWRRPRNSWTRRWLQCQPATTERDKSNTCNTKETWRQTAEPTTPHLKRLVIIFSTFARDKEFTPDTVPVRCRRLNYCTTTPCSPYQLGSIWNLISGSRLHHQLSNFFIFTWWVIGVWRLFQAGPVARFGRLRSLVDMTSYSLKMRIESAS